MKSKSSDSSSQTPAELLEHLRELVSEAETMAADKLGEPAADALETLRTRFASAQKRLGEVYATTKEKVVAGAHCTDEAIRTHPYQAIAIAAAAGLLVGVLLGRRSGRDSR